MCAPNFDHESIISEGHRPRLQSHAESMSAPASAFWDPEESTVVARERPQNMKKYSDNDIPTKHPHSTLPQPKNRTEIFTCGHPGCERKFVNQNELRIHFDVNHLTDEDDFVSSTFDQHSEPVKQRHHSLDDALPLPYPISQYDEKTIKAVPNPNSIPNSSPTPITAAALEALNSDDEPDLIHSMHGMSVSGSDGRLSSASLMSFETTYSVMEELEDAARSEVAEPDSPSVRLSVRILLILWGKFFHDFCTRNRGSHRQNMPYQAASDQRASDSTRNENSSVAAQPSSFTSSVRASKRKENFDDDDGQGNGRRPSKVRPQRTQVTSENRPFACPFNKYDSYTFGGDASNSAYHTCSTWHDVKTAYLKQHIIRNHCLPEYHCVRCGDDFKNDKDLRTHARLNPPCETKEIDSQKLMPEVQLELNLRNRNPASTNRTLYWYKVYDTIFGSEARQRRPVEPHYMGPSHEVLNSFLFFSERRIPEVLRQTRQKLKMNPEDYNENNEQDVQLVRTILQEASQEFMSDRFAARAQSLKDIHEQNTPAEKVEDDPGERTITIKHEKKPPVDQSTAGMPHAGSYTWSQPTDDFSQSPEESFHRQLPHSSPFAPSNVYDPPNMTMSAPLPQQNVGPSAYDDLGGYNYQFTSENFDHALFTNQPDFFATMEDPDIYGPSSIDVNNISGYPFGELPYGRERKPS